jgi:hypothetical protein
MNTKKYCASNFDPGFVQMFATLDKAKPKTGNTRGLNFAIVKHDRSSD